MNPSGCLVLPRLVLVPFEGEEGRPVEDNTLVEGCPLDEGSLLPDSFLPSSSFPAKVLGMNCLLPPSFNPLLREVVLWMENSCGRLSSAEVLVKGWKVVLCYSPWDSCLSPSSFSPLPRKVSVCPLCDLCPKLRDTLCPVLAL